MNDTREPYTMATVDGKPRWDVHNPRSGFGQGFVKTARKVYHPIGFKKGYNFPLFIIGVGALMGFTLSRMMYFDIDERFKRDAIPGEFYYYRGGRERIGLILHLIGVLPGGFLAALQFIPIIRHKLLLFHRLNGYAAIILFLCGNAGVFMIMHHAVGGSIVLIATIGVLGAITTGGIIIAYINIKRLRIDLHRSWMLRTWTWAASIISLRLIQLAALHVMDTYGITVHEAIRCAEIFFMYSQFGVPDEGNPTSLLYPTCTMTFGADGQPTAQDVDPKFNTQTFVSVWSGGTVGPENAVARIRATFTMSAIVALAIHAVAVETYLWLTPAEHHRLRCVSYERQIERGWRKRGATEDADFASGRETGTSAWRKVPQVDFDNELRAMHPDTATRYPMRSTEDRL